MHSSVFIKTAGKVLAFAFGCSLFAVARSYADPALPVATTSYPVIVAKVPNLNDYDLFANGGWDGNWYVGFNTCWIKKLPPIPPGDYARAYVGVKLGRSKRLSGKSVWDKKPIPGSVYMAISSTGSWARAQSVFVTRTEDIPLDGDPENALDAVGESQWFWGEVPLSHINLTGENYLAVWSPTEELVTVSSSPVLAAAWGGKAQDTWLYRDVRGAPPVENKMAQWTPISYFQPAIAMKLIPRGAPHALSVRLINWQAGTAEHLKPVVTATVEGDSVESVWLEYYVDHPPEPNPRGIPSMNHSWAKVGRPLWKAPYSISVEQGELPAGRVQLRVVASNIWEDRAASDPFTVEVSTANAKK